MSIQDITVNVPTVWTSGLLSDQEINYWLEAEQIKIDNFDDRQLGSNSYDVRLGRYFYVSRQGLDYYDPQSSDPSHHQAFWGKPHDAGITGKMKIPAGHLVLTHTRERVGAAPGFALSMYARSSIERSGLSVCRCAGLGDAGYMSWWTMEFANHTDTDIYLLVGTRVAQIVFWKTGPVISPYHGKYGGSTWNNQQSQPKFDPSDMLPKLWQDWDLKDIQRGLYI